MGKSFTMHMGLISILILGGALSQGCTDNSESTQIPAAPSTLEESSATPPAASDTDNLKSSDTLTVAALPKMIGMENGCCETTGHANECWEKDALRDDETGYILCKDNSDCAGRVCNTDVVLSGFPTITENGILGLCECDADADDAGHGDCRDGGKGGTCFPSATSAAGGLCGPSLCNGYYICSCWGGCDWWDGKDETNTPEKDAATLDVYCCENTNYADPSKTGALVTFGDISCSALTPECTVDADCPAPTTADGDEGCVSSVCDINQQCVIEIHENLECTGAVSDGINCTLDQCDAAGRCTLVSQRCGTPLAYNDPVLGVQPNTCVNHCVEGAGTSYTCNENRTVPSDPAVKPSNTICDWWTCEDNGSGTNIPIHQFADCTDESTADACADYECDPSGDQNNCDLTTAVDCSAESVADTCFNYSCDPAGDEGNCDQPTPTITYANDTCSAPIDLGSFDLSSAGTTYSQTGTTACATNDYQSSGANCIDRIAGSNHSLGYESPDLVYSFTYEASSNSYPRNRYIVQLETDTYDGTLYVATSEQGECTAASSSVVSIGSNACKKNGDGTYGIHEDHCYDPAYDTGSECTALAPSSSYNNIARAIVYEDTDATPGSTVTVYIFVDGSIEYGANASYGDFFLSVTMESGCPDVSTWYSGTVHSQIDQTTNQLAVPINGADFPGVTPNQQIGTNGTAEAVLLHGDTRTAGSNSYTYLDAGYADANYWGGYDELWQLDIQTDGAEFYVSMCDYGGQYYNTTPESDPMIGLFNCYGELLVEDDDFSPCNLILPSFEPTPPAVMADSPYYIMVDGFYGGTSDNGYEYDLSVYYEPPSPSGPTPTVECDPTDTDNSTTEITAALPVPGEDVGTFTYYPSGCFTGSAGTWNNTEIGVNTNGMGPGNQCCDCGTSCPSECTGTGAGKCFPINILYDVFYRDSSDDLCIESGVVIQYDRQGNTTSGNILTPQTSPTCGTSYVFDGINIGFEHPTDLTAAEESWCEAQCGVTNNLYIRPRGTTW